VKSGSSSAAAFGVVLQAVRKRLSKNQADVAACFNPKLSIAAVSMAESGNRPPKTESMVRGYAHALEIDADGLIELWWAMQGMVELEDRVDERPHQQWWRDLWAEPQVELDFTRAESKAKAVWTPNEDFYAPSLKLFALANAICVILRRLLGDTWKVDYKPEIGLRDPFDGRLAAVMIELRTGEPEDSSESPELMATFACPEPVTRPVPTDTTMRPNTETISPDVAWILASVEAMPARERAAVAGFIHGLREGASLFSETSLPPRAAR
jgi:transcriptional regulator with XRE-family HTH domain